jgi:hypothetical protein
LLKGYIQASVDYFQKADSVMSVQTRSIAVLMLVGMFLQINSALVCFGLFSLNQKVIAETLCERKMTDCCGHCFLLKKINSTNDTQPAPSGKQASTKTLEELLNVMPGLLPDHQHAPLRISIGNSFASAQASRLPDGVKIQIDHPPKA